MKKKSFQKSRFFNYGIPKDLQLFQLKKGRGKTVSLKRSKKSAIARSRIIKLNSQEAVLIPTNSPLSVSHLYNRDTFFQFPRH